MVENAKKRRHTATKILPSPSPKTLEKASCAMLDWSMPSAAPPAKGPLPAYRVEMTTNAVMVRTRKVSMNTPIMATTPCSCGVLTLAMAWAWGVEPIPASLENSPRLTPWLMAVFKAYPKPPPRMALGKKAYLKIMPKVSGR